MRPGSPGPPPTRATPASLRCGEWRAAIVPARSPAVIASRIAALCRGSPLSTPTLVSPDRARRPASRPSRRPRRRRARTRCGSASASAATRGVDLRPAGAGDDQPGARAVARRRRRGAASRSGRGRRAPPGPGWPPARPAARPRPPRAAAAPGGRPPLPPPTTSTRRPRSRRPSRYASSCPSVAASRPGPVRPQAVSCHARQGTRPATPHRPGRLAPAAHSPGRHWTLQTPQPSSPDCPGSALRERHCDAGEVQHARNAVADTLGACLCSNRLRVLHQYQAYGRSAPLH